jgi:two-component system response regulator RegA
MTLLYGPGLVARNQQLQALIGIAADLLTLERPETDNLPVYRGAAYGPLMAKLPAVLVVDDDDDVRQAAHLALTPHACLIESASSPQEMAGLLAPERFDCVLLDMNFAAGERSGRGGLDALAVIQNVDPALAVVLMTGYGAVSLAVESLKRGARDFLLKPWRNDALVEAVRAASDETRACRAGEPLDVIERAAIERALARHDGNIAQAAAALGLSRPALYRRMAKHGL